ncbi:MULTISPECIES: hypothetical protein [Streptomyces]|uniref:Lipoprotein n=2 Tax=Streptomyces TaxID=1883 RepID=A0A380PA83_STRGR|nr:MULTISPECIES: hypothetical protein [Streptomyces]NEE28729.1 hypothetical protein [Streptomyces sp. SID7982]NEE55690.1 hypothetical protein [Streptomyces sp. SID8455]MBL3806289.1 hypothetical protein [Streptomyces sp. BRB081]PJM84578.1 hypothetical protein CH313_00840 [Streptomyces sp. TSRI0384-2]QNE81562.1 hypothetical protein F0345_10885 [Streptomyces rutgersensis]
MGKQNLARRVAVPAAAVAMVLGLAACEGGDSESKGEGKAADSAPKAMSRADAGKALNAAYKNTSEAKSAKVKMTMSMPEGTPGGGDMEMSGVMGWDPTVLDMTMSGSALQESDPTAPTSSRVIMDGDVMYVDMGAEAAKETDGRRWMKMDLGDLAEQMEKSGEAGGGEMAKAMTGGLENMNQDPAQQIALLMESPNLKHVGPAKVGGEETQHYKGTLSLKEMLDANTAFDTLPEKDRKELVEAMETSGLEGYQTQLWVNDDDLPVKMDVTMETPEGDVRIVQTFSDYGAAAKVEAPAEKDTLDFMDLLKELEGMGAGA